MAGRTRDARWITQPKSLNPAPTDLSTLTPNTSVRPHAHCAPRQRLSAQTMAGRTDDGATPLDSAVAAAVDVDLGAGGAGEGVAAEFRN